MMANRNVKWIRNNIDPDAAILDASETEGFYPVFLNEYKNMDLVAREEADCIRYRESYRRTFHKDITEFFYDDYDVIIFGDALNKMDEVRAKKVLEYAESHSKKVLWDGAELPEANAEEQPVKKPATRKRVKKDE